MSRTYRQRSRLRLEFVTHSGKLEATFSPTKREDVISANLSKHLSQPAGGFQATLVPRQKYLDLVHAGDWVNIYLEDGSNDPDQSVPWMVANVDRVGRTRVVDDKGALTERIQITGRDYGKVLLGIQLVYDPTISNTNTVKALMKFLGQFINNASKNTTGSVFLPPGSVIKGLVGYFHDQRNQFIPPDAIRDQNGKLQSGNKVKLLDYSSYVKKDEKSDGIVSFPGLPNLTGNLWQTIEQFANKCVNELFIDTIGGIPCLFFRRMPFSHADFANLDSFEVDASEFNHEEISCSDDEALNWFRVHMEGAAGNVAEVGAVTGVGYVSLPSVKRFGVKRFEPSTIMWGNGKALATVTNGQVEGVLQDFSRMLAEWYYSNDTLLAGTLAGRLNRRARIGRRMDYTNKRSGEELSFYVEGITHTFQYPGATSTSFNVTRGVARNGMNFPMLKSADDLLLSDPPLLVPISELREDQIKTVFGRDLADISLKEIEQSSSAAGAAPSGGLA